MKLMGQMVQKNRGDACVRLLTEEVKPWVNPVLRLDVQEPGIFGWEGYEPNWLAACDRRLYLSRRGKGLSV